MWINWNDLPENMKNEQVRPYYEKLKQKRGSLITKRLFDILVSLVMLILLMALEQSETENIQDALQILLATLFTQ